MLLTDFNNTLTERLLAFLWRQWVQIGVRASFEEKDRDGWIVDPEALWLLTASIGREDPRLFDAATDWVVANSSFVNIPRLKSLVHLYGFESVRAVAAMAARVRLNNKRLKWSFSGLQMPEIPQPLFPRGSPSAETSAENCDEVFREFGFLRGVMELRGMARQFNYTMPECALLRLRALAGLNARAEIYAYLCTHSGGHPSGIARETGYSQRNIQDTITDMSAAHIVISGQLVGRKKRYMINKSNWGTLLHNPADPPRWMTWPPLFRALEILWTECRRLGEKEGSPLFLSGRLRELMKRLRPLLECEECETVFRAYEAFPGELYSQIFMEDIEGWLGRGLGGKGSPSE
jgi:hypothetical protein